MQRWLASQTKAPWMSAIFGLVIIASAIWAAASVAGVKRYVAATMVVAGVLSLAAGIAALRERHSANLSK